MSRVVIVGAGFGAVLNAIADAIGAELLRVDPTSGEAQRRVSPTVQ